jgi:hypothetical protein
VYLWGLSNLLPPRLRANPCLPVNSCLFFLLLNTGFTLLGGLKIGTNAGSATLSLTFRTLLNHPLQTCIVTGNAVSESGLQMCRGSAPSRRDRAATINSGRGCLTGDTLARESGTSGATRSGTNSDNATNNRSRFSGGTHLLPHHRTNIPYCPVVRPHHLRDL